MTNLSQPEITNLLGELRDMERRIRDLERGNALTGSIPQGQSISVPDPNDGSRLADIGAITTGVGAEFRNANGDIVARIGDLYNGTEGVEMGVNPSNGGNTWLRIDAAGIDHPYLSHPWAKNGDFVAVTGGAFAAIFSCRIELVTNVKVRARVVVTCDVGSTGEFRLREQASGAVTNTVSIGSGGSISQTFSWDLTGSLVLGTGPSVIEFQARRVSGGGNVNVYAPMELILGGITGATSGGT